jgi:hypothetical protein
MIMFVTRRSPIHRARHSVGYGNGVGAAEAVFFILAGLGALGGLAWIFTEL